DLYLKVGDRRYTIRDAARIAAAAKRTPVVCGAGLKDSLERGAVAALEPVVGWRGRRVLMVSSVDRFGMAEALAQQGADVLYGDLIFGLGIDVPLRSLEALKGIARVALAVIRSEERRVGSEWRLRWWKKQRSMCQIRVTE